MPLYNKTSSNITSNQEQALENIITLRTMEPYLRDILRTCAIPRIRQIQKASTIWSQDSRELNVKVLRALSVLNDSRVSHLVGVALSFGEDTANGLSLSSELMNYYMYAPFCIHDLHHRLTETLAILIIRFLSCATSFIRVNVFLIQVEIACLHGRCSCVMN